MKLKIYINAVVQLLVLVILLNCSSDDDSSEPNLAPNTFNLLTVGNNDFDIGLKPTFTWSESTDPEEDTVTYSLILDRNSSPTTIIAENITTTSFLITDRLGTLDIYFWKVIAKDSKGNQTESEIFSFETRPMHVNTLVNNANFPVRVDHTSVFFNDKIWIIGGRNSTGKLKDVWNSSNGVNWAEMTSSNQFTKRSGHVSIVFNNKIWVIGGFGLTHLNDIWSSNDGVNWTLETSNASFPTRRDFTLTVFNNKLWIIGGENGNQQFNDVWNSNDGVTWTEVNTNANFSRRRALSVLAYQDKLWVFSGESQGAILNDVWNSSDGITWTQIFQNNGEEDFLFLASSAAIVFDDKMWLMGGFVGTEETGDVLWSHDGVNWQPEDEEISPRFGHTSVFLNNKIIVIAGSSEGIGKLNDVIAFD